MKPSKNAVAQALKIVKPDIAKDELLRLLNVPHTMTTHFRYWEQTYGPRPWVARSIEERHNALQAARRAIETLLGR